MDKWFDGHTWCKCITTIIKNKFCLRFWKSSYIEHFQCPNPHCDHLTQNSNTLNFSEWSKVIHILQKSSLVFEVYYIPPVCLIQRNARIFLCPVLDQDMIHTTLHLSCHIHRVSNGVYLDALDICLTMLPKKL